MLSVLFTTLVASAVYPVWPDTATWKGTFYVPAANMVAPITTFYDITGSEPRWSQRIQIYDINYLYVGATKYEFQIQNKTCTKSVLAKGFPYPANQFENATLISTVDRVTTEENPVNSWVATTTLGYSITFDTLKDASHTLRRTVHIDEPGWHSEIRIYDEEKHVVDPSDSLEIPSYCQ